MAPANLRNPSIAAALLQFATRYAAKQPVAVDVAIPASVPNSAEGLMDTEATHQASPSRSEATPRAFTSHIYK